MIRLYRGHRLDRLADALAERLRVPAGEPFDPEWVVLGARATERWITARLAERHGVVAHVRFMSASTLLEELVAAIPGMDPRDPRAWRAERIAWRALAALPRHLGRPEFVAVRDYLGGADAGSARAVAFAERVGECFARYALAWPELAERWDAGEGDEWQPVLWRALREEGARHPSELVREAGERLRDAGRPAAIPPRVVWLADPPLAQVHARVIALLSGIGVEVHALVPTPCTSIEGRPRHPLLRSLGALALETDALLAAMCAEAGVEVEHVEIEGDDEERTTLLARVQRDVAADAPRGPGAAEPLVIARDDRSIELHACHGPMRQAEALRDALLRLFDAHAELQPRDVLVLTPDVAAYAPLVEAAFQGGPSRAAIPLRVADHPARRANPVADAVLRTFALAASRVDAVAVLDLLATPAIASRFALADGAEEALRRWVRESEVRWGIDGADRAATHELPDEKEHTWRFGLERLLLGWGMPGEGKRTFGGALPYDEIEGSDAELLGRFAEACTRLFDAVRAVRVARTMPEWRATIASMVDALVVDDDAMAAARRAFVRALDALAEDASPFEGEVAPSAVRRLLESRFADATGAGGAAGAVTLAALRAGRVVPARVVVLLGMDEGTFPRRRSGIGFDLLARERRPGASDPAGEDRLRVLEALLAAREHLVVLYTGRTADTNRAIAPAVPVGELLDAIDAGFVREGERDDTPMRATLERVHPLHPFSPRAFDTLVTASHDEAFLAGAKALAGARTGAPPFLVRALAEPPRVDDHGDGIARVAIDELARFLDNPARELVARRLGAWLDEPDALDVDDPMELDALAAYRLRATLIDEMLGASEDDAERPLALLRAAGRLPHGPVGDVTYRGVRREASGVVRAARAVRRDGEPAVATIDHVVGRWRLVGRVRHLRDRGALETHPGVVRARHLAALWARHLALHLALPGGQIESWAVGKPDASRKETDAYRLAPVSDAGAHLAELLALYERARRERLPFLPESARAYVETRAEADDSDEAHARALDAARKAYAPAGDRSRGEGDDAYVSRLHGRADPIGDPAFAELAMRIWAPLHHHCSARRATR